MQVVILAGVILALTLQGVGALEAPGWLAVAAAGGYLAVLAAMCRLNTHLSLKAIRPAEGPAAGAQRRHNVRLILTHAWLVGGSGGLILVGYGRWVGEGLGLDSVPLVGELLVLLPFFAGVCLSWILEYPFYSAARGRGVAAGVDPAEPPPARWTRAEYLGYNVRHHLLFIAVPVSLIVLVNDALQLFGSPVVGEGPVGTGVLMLASCCAAMLIFLVMPLLIVRIWRTGHLPAGRLRTRLEATCRRMKLRYRDILIWRSGGVIANAGVMGLLGPLRFILLSDGLLERMDDEQIDSVFAHEAGHVVHHHIPYLLVFAVASIATCGAGGFFLVSAAGWPEWVAQAAMLGWLAAIWGIGFGWLSRRFERQSDVTAAWAAGGDQGTGDRGRVTPVGAAIFAQALRRIAQLNGIPTFQRNWRHGSIAWRVAYVLHLGGAAGTREEIDRLVRRIKIGLWAALAAAAIVVMQILPGVRR